MGPAFASDHSSSEISMSEERRQLATIMFTDMVGYSPLAALDE